jgi:antitoxin component of RelBE/YafQ-DinJ toxin-antitoxin module
MSRSLRDRMLRVRLSKKERREMQSVAKERGITVSQLVREELRKAWAERGVTK